MGIKRVKFQLLAGRLRTPRQLEVPRCVLGTCLKGKGLKGKQGEENEERSLRAASGIPGAGI